MTTFDKLKNGENNCGFWQGLFSRLLKYRKLAEPNENVNQNRRFLVDFRAYPNVKLKVNPFKATILIRCSCAETDNSRPDQWFYSYLEISRNGKNLGQDCFNN